MVIFMYTHGCQDHDQEFDIVPITVTMYINIVDSTMMASAKGKTSLAPMFKTLQQWVFLSAAARDKWTPESEEDKVK